MRRKEKYPGPGRGAIGLLTDWALLFLTLAAETGAVVSVYHISAVDRGLLAGVAAASLLALVLNSLPKYKLPLTLLALGAWGYGLWRLWEPVNLGGARLWCDVVNTLANKLPGLVKLTPVAQLPEEVWLQVTTLWLLMVGSIFALVLGFFLCRVGMALPVILLTLLPILPALCVTEAPAALPMGLLLAVWGTLLLTSLVERRDRRGAARLRPAALGASMLALAVLLQTLPTQGTSQPVWAADLREDAIQTVSRMDLSALLNGWEGWRGSGSTEYVSLTTGGASRTGRTALRVHSTLPGKYYLRGYSADVYTGQRWEPLGREARRELGELRENGVEPLLLAAEVFRQITGYVYYSDGRSEPTYNEYDIMTVENVSAPGGCVYYPYTLAELPEGASFGGDSHLERDRGMWSHEIPFYGGEEFRWGGRDLSKREEEQAYREFVYAHELQVPQELRPVLEDWLREVTGTDLDIGFGNEEEFIRAVKGYDVKREEAEREVGRLERQWEEYEASPDFPENVYRALEMEPETLAEDYGVVYGGDGEISERDTLYSAYWAANWAPVEIPTQEEMAGIQVTAEDRELYGEYFRSNILAVVRYGLSWWAEYDLDAPAVPAGEDYVDWFLNHSKKGYCMHFASAAVLLLRTAGIPARYVSGYVVNVPRTGYAVVPDSAAHAWVEYYKDGVGWLPLEVTPGYEGDGVGEHGPQDFEPAASQDPETTATPEPTESQAALGMDNSQPPTPTPSQGPEGVGPGGGADIGPGRSVLGAAALLVLAFLGRYWTIRRRKKRLGQEDTNAAVLWAYRYSEKLRAWGGETPAELTQLAQKARFSQHTLTRREQERAAERLEETVRQVREGLPGWKRGVFGVYWGK